MNCKVLCTATVDLPRTLRVAITRTNIRAGETDSFMSTYGHFFEWVRPKAGAIAFIKFKGPMSSEEFGAQLAEAGIGIKPAYCFMDVVVDDVDYFRIVSTAQCLSIG